MVVLTRLATVCSVCGRRNKCNHKRMVACVANDMKSFKKPDKFIELKDAVGMIEEKNENIIRNVSYGIELVIKSRSYSDANQSIRDALNEVNSHIPQNFNTMFLEKMSQQATSLNPPQRRKFGR